MRRDLSTFVDLLATWQKTHNLVSARALENVWDRHVADSLQLLDHAQPYKAWLDVGSGAGFPGLVVAIAGEDASARRVTLVESNAKKSAFLRAAILATGAPATVRATRIESLPATDIWDIVSARALAPLPRLFGLIAPFVRPQTQTLLLKGRDFPAEVAAARQAWQFDVINHPSVTDSEGVVAEIRNLARKGRSA